MIHSGKLMVMRTRHCTYWTRHKLGTDISVLLNEGQKLRIEATNIKRRDMIYTHPRLMAVGPPGKQRRRLQQLYVRNYDQHLASFFCKNVLAKRKVVIPLR